MTEFDIQQFCSILHAIPETESLVEMPEHSEYLQKQVFDVLKKDGMVDLALLNWDAIDAKDLISARHAEWLNTVPDGWLRGINAFVHATPGAAIGQREFF